jgi:iron complex transport system ATP-binding protein
MIGFAAKGLCVRLGDRPVLADVDIAVAPGELVGLLGPNASGKTTLLRALAGLIEPTSGSVLIDGAPAASVPRGERARRLAYLEQGARSEWPLTVERVVALGRAPWLGPWSRATETDARAVADAMARCDVSGLADRPITALSGGEQARVMLARALAGEPDILLADEPVTHLDPFHQLQIMETIRAQATAGGAVIAVLHDLTLAARFCDRIVLLRDGAVAAEGAPADVLNDETLARVFSITAAFIQESDGVLVVPRGRIESLPERTP